jgi:hypothetical protein
MDGGGVRVAGTAGVIPLVTLGGGGETEAAGGPGSVPLAPGLHTDAPAAVVVDHPGVVIPEDIGRRHRGVVCRGNSDKYEGVMFFQRSLSDIGHYGGGGG